MQAEQPIGSQIAYASSVEPTYEWLRAGWRRQRFECDECHKRIGPTGSVLLELGLPADVPLVFESYCATHTPPEAFA